MSSDILLEKFGSVVLEYLRKSRTGRQCISEWFMSNGSEEAAARLTGTYGSSITKVLSDRDVMKELWMELCKWELIQRDHGIEITEEDKPVVADLLKAGDKAYAATTDADVSTHLKKHGMDKLVKEYKSGKPSKKGFKALLLKCMQSDTDVLWTVDMVDEMSVAKLYMIRDVFSELLKSKDITMEGRDDRKCKTYKGVKV